MKFGKSLINASNTDWKYYYLDYDTVKKLLPKTNKEQPAKPFTEDDEANFVQKLEAELEKVAAFRKIKGEELERRIVHCESTVEKLLSKSGAEVDSATRLAGLEEEIGRITVEVNELSKFVRLNYSGFLKILKKHDKHTGYMLKPMFNVRLAARPFYKESFDPLIIRLSSLFNCIRNGQTREPSSPAPPPPSGSHFVRRTTKYWVHPDDVTEVKCIILKYLPVLVFSSKTHQDPNPAITSIYFDNEQFELYQGRIEKTEGAEAMRIRWYGGMDQTEIFMERKTHREDWTGESSVKSRFSIKEKYVNDYLKGDYSMDKAISKMRERGQKSEKELEDLKTLADEIQETVQQRQLKPMVRTFYNRTAFQLPGDARVRISLDTELAMVREDNFGKERSGNNWRRMDIGIDHPFSQIPADDVSLFPYAILEVKLQTQHGAESPRWVTELIKSHLVEEVPKFSKFIHGVATLLENHVSLLPFWLPQMDKNIRKPAPSGYVSQLSGRADSRSGEIYSMYQNKSSPSRTAAEKGKSRESTEIQIDYTPDRSRDYSIDIDRSTERTRLLDTDDYDGDSNEGPSSKKRHWRLRSLFSEKGTPRSTQQAPAKRIALPVRIEPKVFFANERTFLSWLHFCIVLGGLALGLLNFGDRTGEISGMIFTVVAMLFMLYALFLYQWRAHKIRNRDPGPYDDRIGPTVLVLVLFSAMMTNFYLKLRE